LGRGGGLLVCLKMRTSATRICINKILWTTGLKLTSPFCELYTKLCVPAQDKTRTCVNDATAVRTQNSQFPERKCWYFQSTSTSILRTLLRTYDNTSIWRLPLVTPTFQNCSSPTVTVEYCRTKCRHSDICHRHKNKHKYCIMISTALLGIPTFHSDLGETGHTFRHALNCTADMHVRLYVRLYSLS
jgi:hypothetical protein